MALNTYCHTFYTVNLNPGTVMTRTIYNNTGTLIDTKDISFGGMNVVDVLRIIDDGGTNPYSIGIVDSSLNKASMNIAYCNVFSKALTSAQKKVMINYTNTFKEPQSSATTIYTVTVSGGVYWISTDGGATKVQKPSLIMTVGSLYVFDQSNSSGSIITLSSVSNRSSSYTTGVVTNGVPGSLNAYTLIDVGNTTPNILYYGSAAMGETLNILTSPVMLSRSASTVEVGGSVTITCMTSLSLPLSYTITGVSSQNLNNALLDGSFTQYSESITFNVTSGGGSNMTLTTSGGYSISVNIINPTVKYVMGSIQWRFTTDSIGDAATTNTMAYSYNGTSWTGLGKSIFSVACLSVAYGNGIWVAGGIGATNDLAYSNDGINWTGAGKFWSGDNNYFDGSNTSRVATGSWAHGCMRVKFMNGRFVASGAYNNANSGALYHSVNGSTWTKITLQIGAQDWGGSHDVDYTNYGWVCTTYSNVFYIPNDKFISTATIVASPYYSSYEGGGGFGCACVNSSASGGVKAYVIKVGTFSLDSSGFTGKVENDLTGNYADVVPRIGVYKNVAFIIMVTTGGVSNGYFITDTTVATGQSFVENSIKHNGVNVGAVYNMYFDKISDAWYILCSKGLLKKNNKVYTDYNFDTKIVDINSTYGIIHCCCSTDIGTRLSV